MIIAFSNIHIVLNLLVSQYDYLLLIVLLQFCVSGLKTSNYGNIHDISFVILVCLMFL